MGNEDKKTYRLFSKRVPILVIKEVGDHIFVEEIVAQNIDNELVFEIDGTRLTIPATSEFALPIFKDNQLCFMIGYKDEKIYKPKIETIEKINMTGFPIHHIDKLKNKNLSIDQKLNTQTSKFWDLVQKYSPIVQLGLVFLACLFIIASVFNAVSDMTNQFQEAVEVMTKTNKEMNLEVIKFLNKTFSQNAMNVSKTKPLNENTPTIPKLPSPTPKV